MLLTWRNTRNHNLPRDAAVLDSTLRQQNAYDDLRQGSMLVPLLLTALPAGAF